MPLRRRFPLAAGPVLGLALCAALLAGGCGGTTLRRPPDIVLVVVDTWRWDELGANGSPHAGITPNLDRVAQRGVRFSRAFSPAPWTSPAVASLFTGQYPSVHGAARPLRRIRPAVPTLAEALRARGYRTAAVVNAPALHPALGFERGFDVYDFHASANEDTRRADAVVDIALGMLDASAPEPLFLFVHLFDPHLDYDPVAPWDRAWTDGYAGPYHKPFGDIALLRSGRFQPTPEDVAFLRGLQAGEVAAVDHALGRLFTALDARRRARDVVLAVTADHGEEFGEHGGWEHGHSVHRELTQVPLLLELPPGRSESGEVVETQVRSFDLFPTLLALAGVTAPEGIAGRSLLPLLADGDRRDRAVLSGFLLDGSFRVGVRSYRDGSHALLAWDDGRVALYDERFDPEERADVAAAEPRTVRALDQAMQALVADLEHQAGATANEPNHVEVDEGTEKALRGLGYLE